jgi:hypothetical protein
MSLRKQEENGMKKKITTNMTHAQQQSPKSLKMKKEKSRRGLLAMRVHMLPLFQMNFKYISYSY